MMFSNEIAKVPATHQAFKHLTIFAGAAFITAGAFVFMTHLIYQSQSTRYVPVADEQVTIVQQPEIKETQYREKVKPLPTITPPPQRTTTQADELPGVDIQLPSFKLSPSKPSFDVSGTMPNQEATPIVQIPANYPSSALRDGINGWVEIRFDISQTGQVVNAKVINSEPRRVFNKAALNALKKWKYRPMVNNGKALIQANQTVIIEFNIEE